MSVSGALGMPHVVDLKHGGLFYRDAGDGAPTLLLHGLGNGDIWRAVVPVLVEGGFRCITPDLPLGSHVWPMAPSADLSPGGLARLVVEFLDRLGLDQVIVLTNDAGGVIGQLLAVTYPERIDRLIMTASDNHRQFVPRYFKPLRQLYRIPGLGQPAIRSLAGGPVQRLFFRSVAHSAIPTEIRQSYLGPLAASRDVRRDLLKFFLAAHPHYTLNAARKLHAFTRPAFVVWAGDELWLSRRGGRRLAAAMPNSRFEVIEKSRSFIPEDKPAELAELVLEFLRSQQPVTQFA